VVAGFAATSAGGESRVVRVDLPAAALAAQLRGVRVLTVVVAATDVAVVALLVVFLRRRLQPIGRLVERARRLSPEEGGEAELAVLVDTFERALAALEAPAAGERASEDDIAALSRTLARSLASGVLLLDDRGRVAALNRVGADLLGVPPPAPGTPVGEALAAHPELASLLAGAAAGDEGVQRREVAIEQAPAPSGGPGGRMTLGITVHPLRRDDGEVRGHLALFADLTESVRRAEEARLAESLAGLGELAAGVAHELRNSLATLRGYLTLIERSPQSPGGEETVADYLGEIRRETDHLQRVLEDFLTFARPGTARLEPVELLEVARRAAGDPVLAGVAVEVTDRRGRPVRVHGDPQLLERAVRNLLHNAAQAVGGAGAGPLEVGLERRPEGLALTVDDRGPGLPEEIRERLFQPFVTARPGGVGLGLALTRRIVTLHGGVLRLDDRPGGGTRATIVFPVDVLVTIGNNPDDSPARPGAGETAPSRTE
jgi:signal transduction histidine kinase